MKTKRFKNNTDVFKFINNNKYEIIEIKPIKRNRYNGLYRYTKITSYCIKYKDMI